MALWTVLEMAQAPATLSVIYDDVAQTLRVNANNPTTPTVIASVTQGAAGTGVLTMTSGFSLSSVFLSAVTLDMAPRRRDGVMVPVLSGTSSMRGA